MAKKHQPKDEVQASHSKSNAKIVEEVRVIIENLMINYVNNYIPSQYNDGIAIRVSFSRKNTRLKFNLENIKHKEEKERTINSEKRIKGVITLDIGHEIVENGERRFEKSNYFLTLPIIINNSYKERFACFTTECDMFVEKVFDIIFPDYEISERMSRVLLEKKFQKINSYFGILLFRGNSEISCYEEKITEYTKTSFHFFESVLMGETRKEVIKTVNYGSDLLFKRYYDDNPITNNIEEICVLNEEEKKLDENTQVLIMEYKEYNKNITTERRNELRQMYENLKKSGKRVEYEKTKEWKYRRKKRIEIANGKCEKCESVNNLEAHHKNEQSYLNYANEEYYDLEILCDKCHGKRHKEEPCLTFNNSVL